MPGMLWMAARASGTCVPDHRRISDRAAWSLAGIVNDLTAATCTVASKVDIPQ
jgi:hypothetical protein